MEGQLPLTGGCFEQCGPLCIAKGCDLACPFKEEDYVLKNMEVGGENYWPPIELETPRVATLPYYIPVIRHGFARVNDFSGPDNLAALTLYDIIQFDGDLHGITLAPGDSPAAALRRRFKLSPTCRVLVVSTGLDLKLEAFWATYHSAKIGQLLAKLDLIGITTPNYSFFRTTDESPIPRTDVRWNFRRILRSCTDFSADGLPVIPHLNAQTLKDYKDWARFFKERPHIKYFAKEFQTGLRRVVSAEVALERLAMLQRRVGRPLHPILIGGIQHVDAIKRIFPQFTLVNSVPFMRAMHRRVLDIDADLSTKWLTKYTPTGQPMDAELEYNIRHYHARLERRLQTRPKSGAIRSVTFWRLAQTHGWRGRQLAENFARYRRGWPLLGLPSRTSRGRHLMQLLPYPTTVPPLDAKNRADAPTGSTLVSVN